MRGGLSGEGEHEQGKVDRECRGREAEARV